MPLMLAVQLLRTCTGKKRFGSTTTVNPEWKDPGEMWVA